MLDYPMEMRNISVHATYVCRARETRKCIVRVTVLSCFFFSFPFLSFLFFSFLSIHFHRKWSLQHAGELKRFSPIYSNFQRRFMLLFDLLIEGASNNGTRNKFSKNHQSVTSLIRDWRDSRGARAGNPSLELPSAMLRTESKSED